MNSPVAKLSARKHGFTLTEVLVSMAVLAVVLSLSGGILSALSLNRASGNRMTVTQASSTWLESVSNLWSTSPNFGSVSLLPPLPALAGYTTRLELCEVTPASGVSVCGPVAVNALPTYAGGLLVTTKSLVRLNLQYVSTGGKVNQTTMELSKR